jgi:hypothetical protein
MQTKSAPGHFRDILMLLFSILGIIILAALGIYQVIRGFSDFRLPSLAESSNSFNAFGLFFCAALILPLFIYSIKKLKGQGISLAKLRPVKIWQAVSLLGASILMIILGLILNAQVQYGGLMAAPFFMLGIVLPIAGLTWVAIGGLPGGSWRRLWAAFSIGMTGSTFGAMLLEYSLLGIAALVAGIAAISNPEWLAIFQQIRKQVTNSSDIQAILSTLAPYLTKPLVLILALLFAAVIAPIIEETLKPAAVWLLGKRLHSPAEGFALGAACGAGFALLEGTLAASGNFQMLGIGIAARAASSLLHITASGVMGWGIASALLEKRYARLAGSYLLSLSIHGLWNGSVVLVVFGGLRMTLSGGKSDLPGLLFMIMGIGILASLLIAIMVLLPIINRRLRLMSSTTESQKHSDIIAPL